MMAEPAQEAAVLSVRDLSPTVRELIISPRERHLHFAPGQWVSLKLPVGPRPPLVRAYSMAEPESSTGDLVLVFDRVPDGVGSNYLFTLQQGDTIMISGPHGNFRLPEPLTKDLLFVARFTGIVPIRCMILTLVNDHDQARAGPRMTLVYALPATDRVYDEEFQALAESNSNFRYVPILSDLHHKQDAVPLDTDLLRTLVGDRRAVYPMLAGTKAFVRPLRTLLTEMGFERREIKHETYD
jgi:ferredoxin-NADP reductase